MGVFDFSNNIRAEETIRKTWDEFRTLLSNKVFSYNEIEIAKEKSIFLNVFDGLFSEGNPAQNVNSASLTC